jgi:hypothetical protein
MRAIQVQPRSRYRVLISVQGSLDKVLSLCWYNEGALKRHKDQYDERLQR